jgi:hypothetical protein
MRQNMYVMAGFQRSFSKYFLEAGENFVLFLQQGENAASPVTNLI